MTELLRVRDLKVTFQTYLGPIHAVQGVDFTIHEGETVALVGESGCGKSVTSRAIMQLLGTQGVNVEAEELFLGTQDLSQLSPRESRKLLGSEMAMVFQDPMSSLNPTMRIGAQVTESLLQHRKISRNEARRLAIEILEEVGIPQADKRFDNYPHQFSGGMRQRVMLAIALACRPRLLFADEPTTALDVTIQAQILELLLRMQEKLGMSILLITHDLSVVAATCDRVLVMYAGRIVEEGTVDQIFYHPQHPYTRALLQAVPSPGTGKQKKLFTIGGSPPSLLHPPTGCAFHPRCPHAMRLCKTELPTLNATDKQQLSACWLQHPKGRDTLPVKLREKTDLWSRAKEELA